MNTPIPGEESLRCVNCGDYLLDVVALTVRLGGPQWCGRCLDERMAQRDGTEGPPGHPGRSGGRTVSTLTPEDWAGILQARICRVARTTEARPSEWVVHVVAETIAEAIREAVVQEREAIAAIIRRFRGESDRVSAMVFLLDKLIEEIRARTTPPASSEGGSR